jgi:hypothetical protein
VRRQEDHDRAIRARRAGNGHGASVGQVAVYVRLSREAPLPGQSAMPACDVSSAAVHVLSARLRDVPSADGGPLPGLAEFLAAVPDHRRAQGRRHTLVSILALACAATAAGAKSLVAIAEWAADAPAAVLAALGVRRDPCGGALVVPSETTIRRALSGTDAGGLDEQLAAWLAAATVPQADEAGARISVDGKTMRGAIQAGAGPAARGRCRHHPGRPALPAGNRPLQPGSYQGQGADSAIPRPR